MTACVNPICWRQIRIPLLIAYLSKPFKHCNYPCLYHFIPFSDSLVHMVHMTLCVGKAGTPKSTLIFPPSHLNPRPLVLDHSNQGKRLWLCPLKLYNMQQNRPSASHSSENKPRPSKTLLSKALHSNQHLLNSFMPPNPYWLVTRTVHNTPKSGLANVLYSCSMTSQLLYQCLCWQACEHPVHLCCSFQETMNILSVVPLYINIAKVPTILLYMSC